MFEPETVIYGFALAAGVVVGAVGVLFVQFCRSEAAKQRLIDRQFWPTLERVRQQTGGRIGVVESVPAAMASPAWLRPVSGLPAAVVQPAASEAAWRPVREPRGDAELAAWPVNRGPGAHRLRGDDTQDLRVYAAAFDVPEVAAS